MLCRSRSLANTSTSLPQHDLASSTSTGHPSSWARMLRVIDKSRLLPASHWRAQALILAIAGSLPLPLLLPSPALLPLLCMLSTVLSKVGRPRMPSLSTLSASTAALASISCRFISSRRATASTSAEFAASIVESDRTRVRKARTRVRTAKTRTRDAYPSTSPHCAKTASPGHS